MESSQLRVVLTHLRNLVDHEPLSAMNDGLLMEAFSTRHEEAAFAALLRRHGPMVLSVARRVLHNEHDAEDVFQATFLILARNARSIRRQESVSSWLHGVALRLAMKVRSQKMSRQTREKQAAGMRRQSPDLEAAWRDLQEVLDRALQKLPAKYRTVLLLCYLEGRTQEEVAKQLRCPLGTVRSRLARGRELLRERLARQGLAPSLGALATLLATNSASEAVATILQQQTVKAAALYGAGKAATGLVSNEVVTLVSAGVRALACMKVKLAGLILLASALCVGGTGALAYSRVARSAASPETKLVWSAGGEQPLPLSVRPAIRRRADTASEQSPDEEKRRIAVTGQVVDEKGNPVIGADVAALGVPTGKERGGNLSGPEGRLLVQTKTGADGRFEVSLAGNTRTRFRYVDLVAGFQGHGLGSQRIGLELDRPEVAVKLPSEQVIHGRLLDLQGRPTAGVRISLAGMGRCELGMAPDVQFWDPPKPFAPWPEAVTTDEQGRFVVRGLNRETGVTLQIQDDRFARTILQIPQQAKDAEVSFVLAPAQIIEGRVLAGDTAKPIPNAHVTVYASYQEDFFLGAGTGMEGDTDAQGRFRMNPFAGKAFSVTAYPPEGTPYLTMMKGFKWPRGAARHQIELELPCGIVIRGKVTEADSGTPVVGAAVQYVPLWNNPNRRDELITGWQGAKITGQDGVFQIVVIPGKGHLLVRLDRSDFIPLEVSSGQIYSNKIGGQRMYPHGLMALDLKADERAKNIEVTLRRGVTVRGRVLGPDGNPVKVALMMHRLDGIDVAMSWRSAVEIRDGQFEIHGLDPLQTIPVYFLEPMEQWGTCVQISGRDMDKPLTVRLVPCAKAVARYVDVDGKPLANQSPMLFVVVTPGPPRHGLASEALSADEDFVANLDRRNYWHRPQTNQQGRVTLPALIPGASYRLAYVGKEGKMLHKEFTPEAGKVIDLGIMTVQHEN
jgi:RNA polymerase sigma factor (sigma-70 family)